MESSENLRALQILNRLSTGTKCTLVVHHCFNFKVVKEGLSFNMYVDQNLINCLIVQSEKGSFSIITSCGDIVCEMESSPVQLNENFKLNLERMLMKFE